MAQTKGRAGDFTPKLVPVSVTCEPCANVPLIVTAPTEGGGGGACVVALTPDDCAELFAAASYADTVYVYAVDAVRPVSE